MEFADFNNESEARALVRRIHELVDGPTALMEVCGTHTVAISRYGLRSLMPRDLRLLSGPGCPVCVTPQTGIDMAVGLARDPSVIVATFGDMMRVPGSGSTLEREKADGADVRVLYSPLEALDLASGEADREVVFIGVGFETTSPTVAATVKAAEAREISNFSVLTLFKVVPPALHVLADIPGRTLDGFICPGHVSAIIGSGAYESVAERHNLPCVVVGFEPLDILAGIVMLLEQTRTVRSGGRASVENEYGRAVTREGNLTALALLSEVFETVDSEWREIGVIEKSGYGFSPAFERFDARAKLGIAVPEPSRSSGCICGEIMLGTKLPTDCPLFAGRCVPRDPVGPCMVSTEGACAAFYKYERADA